MAAKTRETPYQRILRAAAEGQGVRLRAVPEDYIQIAIPTLRELIGDERMADIEAACRFHDPLR